MMYRPFVSVIIPGYNVESYIREAIESVLRQKDVDWEMVLIDDGSTDQTGSIMDSYERLNYNISVIHQKNGGQSSARNAGLKIAKGEYILFLDSDDYLEKNALKILYQKVACNNIDMVLFEADSFCEENLNNNIPLYTYTYDKQLAGIHESTNLFLQLVEKNSFKASVCLMLIKKDVLDKNCIRFYDGIIHEDELYCVQLFLACEQVIVVNSILYKRRYRPNSTMTVSYSVRHFRGYKTVIYELISILKKKKLDEKQKKAVRGRIEVCYWHINSIYFNLSGDERRALLEEYKSIISELKKNRCCIRIETKIACNFRGVYFFVKKYIKR